jgi:hypothetical protein
MIRYSDDPFYLDEYLFFDDPAPDTLWHELTESLDEHMIALLNRKDESVMAWRNLENDKTYARVMDVDGISKIYAFSDQEIRDHSPQYRAFLDRYAVRPPVLDWHFKSPFESTTP